MRRDHFGRLYRQGSSARDEAIAAGGKHPFDPDRPWEWVFRAAIRDKEYWSDEFIEHALLIKVDPKIVGTVVGDDAPVLTPGAASAVTSVYPAAANVYQPPRGPAPSPAPAAAAMVHAAPVPAPPVGPPRPGKRASKFAHNLGADGLFKTNRQDRPLCRGFQTGQCLSQVPGRLPCPANPTDSHQCGKCLSPMHGAHACPNKEVNPQKQPRKGAGRGRGAGGGAARR